MQLRLFDVQLPLKFFLRMKRLALLAGAFASLLFSARAATTTSPSSSRRNRSTSSRRRT
jgi:hypothetical protein